MNRAIFNLHECTIRIEKGLIIIQSTKPLSHVPEEFYPFDTIEDKNIDDLIRQIIGQEAQGTLKDLPKLATDDEFWYMSDEELLKVFEEEIDSKKYVKQNTEFPNFTIIPPQDVD